MGYVCQESQLGVDGTNWGEYNYLQTQAIACCFFERVLI